MNSCHSGLLRVLLVTGRKIERNTKHQKHVFVVPTIFYQRFVGKYAIAEKSHRLYDLVNFVCLSLDSSEKLS